MEKDAQNTCVTKCNPTVSKICVILREETGIIKYEGTYSIWSKIL